MFWHNRRAAGNIKCQKMYTFYTMKKRSRAQTFSPSPPVLLENVFNRPTVYWALLHDKNPSGSFN